MNKQNASQNNNAHVCPRCGKPLTAENVSANHVHCAECHADMLWYIEDCKRRIAARQCA